MSAPKHPHADLAIGQVSEQGYDLGLHGSAELGTVHVGVSVEGHEGAIQSVGLFVDAPRIGKLLVALALQPEGAPQLTSVARLDANGVAAARGSVAQGPALQLAKLGAELALERRRTADAELALAKVQAMGFERSLPQAAQTIAELETVKAKVEELEDSLAELSSELQRSGAQLVEAGARASSLEKALASAKASGTAADLDRADAAERVATLEAELDASRASSEERAQGHRFELETLSAELESERAAHAEQRNRRSALERELAAAALERDQGLRKLNERSLELDSAAALKAEAVARAVRVERQLRTEQATVTELSALRERLTAEGEQSRAALEATSAERDQARQEHAKLTGELTAEREISKSRLEALTEERHRRDELIQDIAFIRSEVADLSTSKGSLLDRLDEMARREDKRQATTGEINNLLRDAEVVSSDRQTSLRRMQARAEKLEGVASEAQAELASVRAQLEEASKAQQVVEALISERDALKVQISYFQKQIGAYQRQLNAAPPSSPGSAPHRRAAQPSAGDLPLPAEWSESSSALPADEVVAENVKPTRRKP